MSAFTRKNVLVCTATFKANDGSTDQPTAAYAVIYYKDQAGLAHTTTVTLSHNSSAGTWTGTWDSSAAGDDTPDWMVYGTGTLQASTQGSFKITANKANVI